MKYLDRINRMDRIVACAYHPPRSGYVFRAALPERSDKSSC